MPVLIIAEKGKPMGKKKGFLDYGKDDADEDKGAEEKGDDEDEGGAAEMRLRHLAEKTGVDDPDALIKLIKACMKQG